MYRAETEILNAEQEELHHETSFAVCPSSIFCMSKTFFEAENDLGIFIMFMGLIIIQDDSGPKKPMESV